MSMNPLPPQAYTKDALQKAYAWLMNQPASIRELATTPDVLVSLYLKTQRDGMESLERPSIQNFRSELKQLAGMMSEFSEHDHQVAMPTQMNQYSSQASPPQPVPVTQQSTPHLSQQLHHHTVIPPRIQTSEAPAVAKSQATAPAATTAPVATIESQKMIQEVKERLGFSSDHQALEALIRVGYHHLVARVFKP